MAYKAKKMSKTAQKMQDFYEPKKKGRRAANDTIQNNKGDYKNPELGKRIEKAANDTAWRTAKTANEFPMTEGLIAHHLTNYPGDLPMFEGGSQKGSGRHAATNDIQFGGK